MLRFQIDSSTLTTASLPSTNPRCLEIWLYLNISKVPFAIERTSYPYFPLTGELPCLKWGRDPVPSKQCVEYLKENFCDIDEGSSKDLCSDSVIYRDWLFETVDIAHSLLESSHLAQDTYAQVEKQNNQRKSITSMTTHNTNTKTTQQQQNTK